MRKIRIMTKSMDELEKEINDGKLIRSAEGDIVSPENKNVILYCPNMAKRLCSQSKEKKVLVVTRDDDNKWYPFKTVDPREWNIPVFIVKKVIL